MNKILKTERQTEKIKKAECEKAVSLRHGLGNAFIFNKVVLSATQKTINSLRFLVLNGTTEIPKQECQALIIKLEKYLSKVSRWQLQKN
jgi:hypothetical protein